MDRGLRKLLKRLLPCAIALVGAFSACAEGDGLEVLWWQVGDWEDETGTSLGNVSVERLHNGGTTTAAELGVDSARIREVTTGTYLKMLDIDESGTTHAFTLDSMSVPMTWVADVSAFSSGSAAYAFVIELGNYESGTWATLAVSESASYADLRSNGHIYDAADTYMPGYASSWTPTSYVVPEPNSGLLTLMGCILFALKRKRRLNHG